MDMKLLNKCEGTKIFVTDDLKINNTEWHFIYNNYSYCFNRNINITERNIIMEIIDEKWREHLEQFIVINNKKLMKKQFFSLYNCTFYWEFPSISDEEMFYLKLKVSNETFERFFDGYNNI